jgi:hypothetical protein
LLLHRTTIKQQSFLVLSKLGSDSGKTHNN